MPMFRKKPVVIEAVYFDGWADDRTDAVKQLWPVGWDVQTWRRRRWSDEDGASHWGNELLIPTLEGVMQASPGDWIIKGIKGEFYPCKPDIFMATYELERFENPNS